MFKKILPQSEFGQVYIGIFAGLTLVSVALTAASCAADAIVDSI